MTTIAGFAAPPATNRGISSFSDRKAILLGGRLRTIATGSLGVFVIAMVGAFVFATRVDAAQANRAKAEALVQQAEQLVAQAHQAEPLDTDKVKAAMVKLREAIAADPRDDSAYIDLGFCYGLLREPESAVEMYRKATTLNPSPANFKELADIYLRTGDYENALMAANAGLQKDSCNAPLLNAKGMALHYLMRFDETREALKKAVACDPSFEDARRNLEAVDADAVKATSKAKH